MYINLEFLDAPEILNENPTPLHLKRSQIPPPPVLIKSALTFSGHYCRVIWNRQVMWLENKMAQKY